MKRIKKTSTNKAGRDVAAMLELHARSLHLPHIRRYHAVRRRQSKIERNTRRAARTLKGRCRLPMYLLDPPGPKVDLKKARKCGQVQFQIWNKTMPIISEIDADLRLFSVATGDAVTAQHRVLERFISSKQIKNLSILSVPVLHFRGLVFVRKKDAARMIVPLRSAVPRLIRGKTYSSELVQRRLEAALANRISAAKRIPVPKLTVES